MNIDNYINHWKNMILKESGEFIPHDEKQNIDKIDEAFKPSFLDVKKLVKKVYTPEEVEELYSSAEVKLTIEKNYEKLSQEEKNRI
jgi:D-ribose pyranose/furanose isomerase RbsD